MTHDRYTKRPGRQIGRQEVGGDAKEQDVFWCRPKTGIKYGDTLRCHQTWLAGDVPEVTGHI